MVILFETLYNSLSYNKIISEGGDENLLKRFFSLVIALPVDDVKRLFSLLGVFLLSSDISNFYSTIIPVAKGAGLYLYMVPGHWGS